MNSSGIFPPRLALGAALLASAALTSFTQAEPPYLGGDTTIVLPPSQATDRGAFGYPASNLSLTRKDGFFVGNSFFEGVWVSAPASTTARDGLGPLFNTMSCQSCHVKDGRGRPPREGENMLSMLARVSIPAVQAVSELDLERRGVAPHPVYGDQIQNHALLGQKPEGIVEIEWEEVPGTFADGKTYSLRKPVVSITELGYGDVPDDLEVSLRVAPQMIGLGLLEAIPEESLRALEDPEDANGDGISGRRNLVWDIAKGAKTTGRFGWKAEQPNVRQQVASAFAGDIGITSTVFTEENHMPAQKIIAESGGVPEVTDEILDFVTFYSKLLAVPAQRSHDAPTIMQGRKLFHEAQCVKCHVETFQTGKVDGFPELSNQEIHPYTDLLLHDMGEGLADNRPAFEATGREWRTPPLWGIGMVWTVNQHTNFLHDGRARSIEEAILWHGGEAEASREAYVNLSESERRKLLAFVNSL